jgi:hypothetical protein
MTLGVGATNELDVSELGGALDDVGSTTTAEAVVEVAVPEGVPGAAVSLEHPARPANTATTRATAHLLVIGRTPLAAFSNPSTITATCSDEKPSFGMWTTDVGAPWPVASRRFTGGVRALQNCLTTIQQGRVSRPNECDGPLAVRRPAGTCNLGRPAGRSRFL